MAVAITSLTSPCLAGQINRTPEIVENPVTTIDHSPTTSARTTLRETGRAASLERRFLEPEIETAPREEIEALQEARILELVPYAWSKSAFYRELWSNAGVEPSEITSLDDFRTRIPTFEKADTQAFRERTGDPFGGLLCM